MNANIDKHSKQLFDGAVKAFNQLKTIEMICMNLKIALAKLPDNSITRGLRKTEEIIFDAVKDLENFTMMVKELSKKIGIENRGD